YFLAPFVSVGADLRYQRWLNPPFGGPKQGDITASDPRIDSLSFGVGPRFHFLLGNSIWLRPGIAYSRGLDKPLAASTPNYHVVQIDVPVLF
ncbi:MAG TPA: hypothetical protein VM580_18855, partial [Labilithrix sp.]|nr:hypothetical protein [Labilithrix sp.]